MIPAMFSDPLILGVAGVLALGAVIGVGLLLRRLGRARARDAAIEAGFAAIFPGEAVFAAPVELPMPRLLESRFARTVKSVEAWHEVLSTTHEGMRVRLVMIHAKVRMRTAQGKSELVDRYYPMARVEDVGVEIPELVVQTKGAQAGMLAIAQPRLGKPELDARYSCEGPEHKALVAFFAEPIVEVLVGFEAEPALRVESKQNALLLAHPERMDAYAARPPAALTGQPLASYHKHILWQVTALGAAMRRAHGGA